MFRRTKWPLNSSLQPVPVVRRKRDALLCRHAKEEAIFCRHFRGGSVVNRVLYILVVSFLFVPNEDRSTMILLAIADLSRSVKGLTGREKADPYQEMSRKPLKGGRTDLA